MAVLFAGVARSIEVEPAADIRAAAEDFVSQRLAPGAHAVASNLDPRLHLARCGGPLTTQGDAPNPRNAWTIPVHCEGPVAWTIYVPVRVQEPRRVLVLARSLAAGSRVTADCLAVREVDVGTLGYGYLSQPDEAVGHLLRRPLPVGAPLSADALEAPRAIRRGQEIVLLGRVGDIEVRAAGKALADGATGDHIRAENIESHRIVEGVVRDEEVVEVGL